MRTSVLTAMFPAPPETVWTIVTNNSDTSWRSDITRTCVKEGGSVFVETAKGGMETTFHITRKEPYQLYSFTLENRMICGEWTGEFSAAADGTKVVFTERVRTRSRLLGFLAYLMPIKAMQQQYVTDLQRRLVQQI